MSIVTLIEARPRRASDAAVQTLRVVANSRKRADFMGQQWRPILISVPGREARLGFDGTSFGNGSQSPQIGQFSFVLDAQSLPFASHMWKNAEIIIRTAPWPAGTALIDPADGDFTARTCRAESAAAKDGVLTITMLDPGIDLARPVSQRLFGTSGDALLDGADAIDFKGQTVPMGWGELLNIRGMLVDRTYGIYLLLGCAATSMQRICDGGADFTLGVGRASLAALRATTPAAGASDYCLNAGGLTLVRPWDKPTYPLTADVTVGSTTPADIANAIVTSRTGLTFTAGAVAAINGLIAAPAQIYVEDTKTIATALDEICAGLAMFWRLNAAGTIDLIRYGFTAPVLTLGSWQVEDICRRAIIMPTGSRAIGYARNNHVLGENEIAKAILADDAASLGGVPAAAVAAAIATAATTANWSAVVDDNGHAPAPDADVTAVQPIVSRLSSSTGQALDTFILANGLSPQSIVASGSNRDGDAITFAAALPSVPKIIFLPGGNAATAGQNIAIQAVGTTASGFTLKAKSQVVSAGTTYTDGSASSGSGAEPDKVINRSNASHPYDNRFKFNFAVTVGNIAPGEPGYAEIGIFVKISGSWVQCDSQAYGVSGTYELTATLVSADFGAGNEFGIDLLSAEGSGSGIATFNNVKYTAGSVTETSLTPSGASDIPWIAQL